MKRSAQKLLLHTVETKAVPAVLKYVVCVQRLSKRIAADAGRCHDQGTKPEMEVPSDRHRPLFILKLLKQTPCLQSLFPVWVRTVCQANIFKQQMF